MIALWFATGSSFAARGMVNLPVHMINHILVMFLVPIGMIASGFARSLWWIPGTHNRRRLLRWWYVQRRWRAPRLLRHPLFAALVLNVVMVASHTPRVFNFMMVHGWAMDWLMEPAFLLSGLYFFHFIVTSPPRVLRTRLRYQLVMIVVTMFEMLVLAMAMSIFTTQSWYSSMVASPTMTMPGMATSVEQAFHQQQLAAAILWICGDFWAIPCIVVIVRRLINREGTLFGAMERQSTRLSGAAG